MAQQVSISFAIALTSNSCHHDLVTGAWAVPLKSYHRLKIYHQKPAGQAFEKLMLLVAVVEPLMTMPQVIEIYGHSGPHSISLVTWAMYFAASILWVIYGLKTRNRPIMISGLLWVIMDGAVVAGVLFR